MTSNDEYVLEILKEQELVTPEQLVEAERAAQELGISIVDALVDKRFITEEEILRVVANQFGLDVISLEGMDISPEIRDLVPAQIARRHKLVPVMVNEDTLIVAISDPFEFDALDTLRYMLNRNIEAVIAPKAQIQGMLERYYSDEADVEKMLGQISQDVDIEVAKRDDMITTTDDTAADAPIIKLVSLLIVEAFRNRASDIHLEPMEKRFRVRYRIDGVLHEVDSPPKRLQQAIISRIKLMAGMKIAEKRIPQDGRIQVNIMGRELDLRVSSIPASHGESIVMRILDKQNLALGLTQLGFFGDDLQTFERLITLADGIILVTGPTGSGKTTTLYACLSYINKPDKKIITVEDPVEYQISGINQVQVREDIGLTFAACLRSILRQAPNVIMIGEIRDLETANIAIMASLTGHLVFSTLHTNDAPSAVTRLLDIGVKPFLVSSALRAAMAQRLVRCICDNCKEVYQPTKSELNILAGSVGNIDTVTLYKGRGCKKCALTGYYGRKGIFEIFQVNEEIQAMIYQKVPASILREKARQMGMRTLREDGLRKVAAGITTIDEVLRVTMGDVS